MPDSAHRVERRVRVLATIALLIALTSALGVRVGLNDGGWPLFVPAIAAAAVLVWPVRVIVSWAIAITAACVVLGLMSVGIFYGLSLAALIFALAEFRAGVDRRSA
jgi:hypothetical protein